MSASDRRVGELERENRFLRMDLQSSHKVLQAAAAVLAREAKRVDDALKELREKEANRDG